MPTTGVIGTLLSTGTAPPRPAPALSSAGMPLEPSCPGVATGLARRTSRRPYARASGVRLWDTGGREILDGTSGNLLMPAGHCRDSIAQAVARQLLELDDAGTAHPAAQNAAQRLAALAPAGIAHVQFAASARDALALALECCTAVHATHGESHRNILLGDLHPGSGLAVAAPPLFLHGPHSAASVSRRHGLGSTGAAPAALVRLPRPHLPGQRFVKGQSDCSAEWLDDAHRLLQVLGPHHIAACVIEPVGVTQGLPVPPMDYLEGLRALCSQYGILLVFDETRCGMGHTGAPFAAHSLGVVPDLLVAGHGLTNGTLPLGAVLIGESAWPALAESPLLAHIDERDDVQGLAGPAAHAAAAAMLATCHGDNLFEHAARLSADFLSTVFALSDLSILSDIRGFGLLAGLEIDAHHGRYAVGVVEIQRRLLDAGLQVGVARDSLLLAPGLAATQDDIGAMCAILRSVLTVL